MGSTNHGAQEITYEYFEEASAEDFNKRHLGIRPRGIYSGGYLTRVSDIEVTLSIFTAEIGDGDEQISVRTSAIATLNAASLDSGDIDPATPYIVLRWGFLEQQNNYVEVHAITSVAVAQADDIIVGKCVFSGSILTSFIYTDRTFLNVQDLFLKVETLSLGAYVQLRAGRISDGTQSIFIPEQRVGPFSDPGATNSRIDLVYIASDGTVTILQGTAAVSPVAPDYGNKLVVAEVTVVNGLPGITLDKIKDVRSFITSVAIPAGNILGVWESKLNSTIYQAATDGRVHAYSALAAHAQVIGYTDGSTPPTTVRTRNYIQLGASNPCYANLAMDVRKGDYWKVTGASVVWWIPIGS